MIDSGIGGLSVWIEVAGMLNHESIIYIGDQGHAPYSIRKSSYIINRVHRMLSYLKNRQVKMVIIACNSATVAGIDDYRRNFPEFPIIGIVPVIKTAVSVTKSNVIAVLATEYTVKSEYYRNLIRKYSEGKTVISVGNTHLVRLVEEGNLDQKPVMAELREMNDMHGIKRADVIALGCTHFPFLTDSIKEIFGENVTIMDSGAAVARHTQRIILQNNIAGSVSGKPVYEFFTTGNPKKASDVASRLLRRSIEFKNLQI